MHLQVKKILLFLGLTFFLDWAMVYLFLALGGKWQGIAPTIIALAYMFVPMVIAIIVQKVFYREALIKPLGISFRINSWFFVAWFLPPLIAFATMGVSLLLPGITFTPDLTGFFDQLKNTLTPEQIEAMKAQISGMPVHPIWLMLLQGMIAGTTINAVAGFGEELGWRGLFLKELSPLGFWKSSLVIGIIWGIWHAPLILLGHNYPLHPQIGVLMMTAWTVLMAPLFSYIRLKAKSVIASSIFHGTINATYGLAIVLVAGGDDLTIGLTGLAGFIVFAVADILLFMYDRLITGQPVNTILKNLPK